PPPGHELVLQGKLAEYRAAARAFLNKQPQSDQAPQVAGNLFLVATGNEKEIDEARLRLFAEYPGSITARYLLADLPVKEYGTFLGSAFDKAELNSDPKFLQRFFLAIAAGEKHYGAKFADDALLLKAAIAAPDGAQAAKFRRAIRHLAEKDAQALDIVWDPALT